MNAKNLGLPAEYLFVARLSVFLIYIKGGFNVVEDEKKTSTYNITKLAC